MDGIMGRDMGASIRRAEPRTPRLVEGLGHWECYRTSQHVSIEGNKQRGKDCISHTAVVFRHTQ